MWENVFLFCVIWNSKFLLAFRRFATHSTQLNLLFEFYIFQTHLALVFFPIARLVLIKPESPRAIQRVLYHHKRLLQLDL